MVKLEKLPKVMEFEDISDDLGGKADHFRENNKNRCDGHEMAAHSAKRLFSRVYYT